MPSTHTLTHDFKSFEKIRKNQALRQSNAFEFLTHVFDFFASEKMPKSPVFMQVFELFKMLKMRQKS